MILLVGPNYPVNLDLLDTLEVFPTAVILINWREYNYLSIGNNPSLERLLEFVNKRDLPLYIINGTWNDSPPLHDQTDTNFKNVVQIENYGLYVLKQAYVDYLNSCPSIIKENYVSSFNCDFKFLFICLNNKPHAHRCKQIDKLEKYNLIHNNAISWNSWYQNEGRQLEQSQMYFWKYWTPKLLILDNMESDGWGCQIPAEFKNSSIQLITETSADVIILSEKLVPALIYNKPFIVSGAKGYHSVLEKLGFRLYTEIFNYEFDNVDDTGLRFEMIAAELNKLRKYSNSEIVDLCKQTTIFNKKRFIELMESDNFNSKFINQFNEGMINYLDDNVLWLYRKNKKELT